MRFADRLQVPWRWIGRHSLGTLLSLVALGGGLWSFAEIADEMGDDEARTVDERLMLAMREAGDLSDPIGPVWVETAFRDMTALGGITVLALLVFGIVGFLLLRRAPGLALVVLIATAGAKIVSALLKDAFGRPRPELVSHLVEVSSAAFPSGHALGATAAYLTLAALLAAIQTSLVVKAYVLAWGLVTAVVVGVSRVYLGVHWPTDVAAGWAIGATWAALWWLLVQWLLHRGLLRYPSRPANGDAVAIRPGWLGGAVKRPR